MTLSVFDVFRIGIGPSSSHTVGPMRAAASFAKGLRDSPGWENVARVLVELYGSLAATGKGHATDSAILLGLEGEDPETVDPVSMKARLAGIREGRQLSLGGEKVIPFTENTDLLFHRGRRLPYHSNGMTFTALDSGGSELFTRTCYSVGGGQIAVVGPAGEVLLQRTEKSVPYAFRSCRQLLEYCEKMGCEIWELVLENEKSFRSQEEVDQGLDRIWQAMLDCVNRGIHSEEPELPGGLHVRRRAPGLYRNLTEVPEATLRNPLNVLDWVDLYALAVNEENAAGGRVVTAPTNGSSGVVPAVGLYFQRFTESDQDGIRRYLLTAGAVAMLYIENASISGAEVGCQGEVGVACSMAAAGLVAALRGTNRQAEYAAEIGMEHNLGLTCDPVGGLVQIPCIERNAMGAVKAINAARLALRSDGTHMISLDRVIATMRRTGADMQSRYKETSRGGLAVNIVEC